MRTARANPGIAFLERKRELARISRQEVVDRLDISPAFACMIVAGRRRATPELVEQWARALDDELGIRAYALVQALALQP